MTLKILLSLLAAVIATPLYAAGSPPPKAKSAGKTLTIGTHHDWAGYFDEVQVLKPVAGITIKRISVAPITAGNIRWPSETDNTHKAVKDVVANASKPFLAGLKGKLANQSVTLSPNQKGGGSDVMVRTRISRIDPGSQAARYWGSFSAGAAIVELEGEIVDPRSNTVLIRFRQERRSGWGLLGGGYHALLDRNLKQIGGDVAGLLNAM